MFPDNWEACKEPARKRPKGFMDRVDDEAVSQVPLRSSLPDTIERYLLLRYTPGDAELDVDHLLSRVPYKSMLENLYGATKPELPALPVISKSWEESFMRQPATGERACAMGEQCECMFIDRNAPFVGVEFRLQGDPETAQLCVLCSRRLTQKLFYDMSYTGQTPKAVIQRYGNVFGQAGEYATECMLVCPAGLGLDVMPLPIMSHQRNRYSVVTRGGTKYLRQHRVGHEDFVRPSDMAQHTLDDLATGLRVKPLRPGPVCEDLPGSLSEGGHGPHVDFEYIPGDAGMDHEVARIHELARAGEVDHATAEAHIHAYLAAAAYLQYEPGDARTARRLVMPARDAPQFGTLPDLGRQIRGVLAGEEPRDFTAGLVAQALPCLRRAHKPLPGPCTAALNLLLGLVLGLYPDVGKRPPFGVRARLFGRVHRLLTSEPAVQAAFVASHAMLVVLACMEYLARVVPSLLPAEHEFLVESYGMGAFFERTPLHCDEMRQLGGGEAWVELESRAAAIVERSARVKRKATRPGRPRGGPVQSGLLSAALACPSLADADPAGLRMLSHAYGLPADVLKRVHGLVRVADLPVNLQQAQAEALRERDGCQRAAWMCTRLPVCLACLCSRDSLHRDFRVNTLTAGLVCSECFSPEVVCLDVLGRVARLAGRYHVFCQACCSVHAYEPTGDWPQRCCRPTPSRDAPAAKQVCVVCEEPHQPPGIERVDHLTGSLVVTYYCQRHAPNASDAELCVNTRQLVQLEAATAALRPAFYMPRPHAKASTPL